MATTKVTGFWGIVITLIINLLVSIRDANWFIKVCGDWWEVAEYMITLAICVLQAVKGEIPWSDVIVEFDDPRNKRPVDEKRAK